MYNITCSIVLYNNSLPLLKAAINSFLNTELPVKLYLIDNSPYDTLRDINIDDRIEYVFNPSNPGFGTGHNIAIQKVQDNSAYHLILNPDISYKEGVLEQIVSFMDQNPEVGVLMPKVLFPDGKIQCLAKLLPTPLNFVVRRFVPIKRLREKIDYNFELKGSNYDKIISVPFLSGCFLLFRTEVLKQIGGFDENIFMYTEDIDICRRVIDSGYQSVFYPLVYVYHDHEVKSFKSFKNFKVYLKSAIYYFNKWGWFYDKRRKEINDRTLNQLKTS